MGTFFTTFADHRYKSLDRISKEALMSGFFDGIFVGDENSMFEKWYIEKYSSRFKDRGFGFWMWKSYIIRCALDKIEENDFLIYLDAGSTINKRGLKRLKEYTEILNKDRMGVLLFSQELNETAWTKGDVFSFFYSTKGDKFETHRQTSASVIIIRKCYNSFNFINEWFYISHNHYNLINDSSSIENNHSDFIEHRYDQSLLSMLSVKYNIKELSDVEIYTENNDWNTNMISYPFWVTRYRNKKDNACLIKSIIKKFLSSWINVVQS